jgi:hypothetical protein
VLAKVVTLSVTNRHTWLNTANNVSVVPWGVYVPSYIDANTVVAPQVGLAVTQKYLA